MDDMLRVLVIIPAYNEQANIVQTVSSVVEAGYDYVVVNDGSTDNTLSICRQYDFNVLDLPQNLGIGGAVQAGRVDLSSFKLYGQAALGNALSSWRAFPGRQISEPFYS